MKLKVGVALTHSCIARSSKAWHFYSALQTPKRYGHGLRIHLGNYAFINRNLPAKRQIAAKAVLILQHSQRKRIDHGPVPAQPISSVLFNSHHKG